jgi:hypothetical protein
MNLHRRPGRLAVSAALLFLLTACGTKADTPAADPTSTDTSTPSSTPSTPGATTSATAAPDKLTTTGLATGPAPKIAYAVKGRLVLPDGGGFALPRGAFDLARLGALTVVMVSGSGDDATVQVLGADGTVLKTDRSVSGALVVNDAHDVVTWLGVDNEPRVLDRGGDRIVSLPAVERAVSVVDINGYLDCQEAGALGGCTALVNADDGHAYVSTSHGFTDLAGPMIWANGFVDSARGGVIGMVSQSDDGSCNGLWREGRKPEWQTCQWRFLGVSPQSTAIVTGSPYADGFGDGALGFLDVDGQLLHAWTGGGATVVSTPVWEDDQHVLAVVFQDEAWSVVRFGVDGTLEYAVPPQPGADLDNPFLLQTT